jgi:hypothetical protein
MGIPPAIIVHMNKPSRPVATIRDDDDECAGRSADLARSAKGENQKAGDNRAVESASGRRPTSGERHRGRQRDQADRDRR